MHRVALLVAHQRKAARQHAAIGQRGQQLPGMHDAGLLPLHQDRQRAAGALGEPQRAFAVARDAVTLRLRIGELRGLQPDFEAAEAFAAPVQQRARRQSQPFAADDDPLCGVADLGAQHAAASGRR